MATEMDPAAKMLLSSEPLRKPILQEMIASLHLPMDSQGLDVGCGIGLQTALLAQAVGPKGHVTGMDFSPSFLETARMIAGETNFVDRVSFQQGRWGQIPFPDHTFDWVWSVDAAGYAPQAPVQILQELTRVVKPGGSVILGYWSSQSLLPGYPALESRLNASRAGIAPFEEDAPPETHFLRALGWMHETGLDNRHAGTFVRSISAPLSSDLREALTALFDMRWGSAEGNVSLEDWRAFQRLCQAESADFILNCPDYYAFFTYSVFSGRVSKKGTKPNV